ncbi:hypothetical protein NEOLEDRAFT_448477 [Neolentinus lepideus HHB14362 ss-1]|uniref:Uncharacterized protein n=1 Tax=Neolentinus lepideus HHB14362 ss-1 TaxID=1314782 RepID=A0A165RSW6_9AGAM|nr:hypothetical protein NEOLEDRAFT_448477 [Neolentinus lepideus HHB14362 ss-1]
MNTHVLWTLVFVFMLSSFIVPLLFFYVVSSGYDYQMWKKLIVLYSLYCVNHTTL